MSATPPVDPELTLDAPAWASLPWDLPRAPALWQAALALPELPPAPAVRPEQTAAESKDPDDAHAAPRQALRNLAAAGLLHECVPAQFRPDGGGPLSGAEPLSVRALCTLRWALAYRAPLYDLMFAMQGLGSYPVTLMGSTAQRAALLPAIARGTAIGAFALTEPEAGSDVSALRTAARSVPGGYLIDGHKLYISNAGLATQYVLFVRTAADPRKGLSALLLPAETAGLSITPQRLLCDGHPIGELHLREVFLPESARIGAEGEGMPLAMRTLDAFRATVGAAAMGMAQRALFEARRHTRRRVQFGKPLADQQATQMALAEMATGVEAAALLVQRAAYLLDQGQRASRESSMAKLFATEAAQQVVDRAVQLHGAAGLVAGSIMEQLYREVRALRIYEGASEVQRLIIARELLRDGAPGDGKRSL